MSVFPKLLSLCLLASSSCSMAECRAQDAGVELTYELVGMEGHEAQPKEIAEALVSVINKRLGDLAVAKATRDDKIVVQVQGVVHDEKLAAIRDLVGAGGELQFRIMASREMRAHAAVRELAEGLSSDEIRMDGEVIAKWFDCHPREFATEEAARDRGLVTRMFSDGKLQALALMNDKLNVTGDFLRTVAVDVDENGKPQVAFSFNEEGGRLFGQLTEQHLPTADGQRNHLGVILDDVVLSAPSIESKITDRGRISGGNLTEEEVDRLATIFKAGQLPSALREVGMKRKASEDKR